MSPVQVSLFPSPRREPPPAPPPRPAPPSFVPDPKAGRQREEHVRRALATGPVTLEQLARRTNVGIATLTATLPFMADDGLLVAEPLYRLPGPLDGRWMTSAELRTLDGLLAEIAVIAPRWAQRIEAARAALREDR